MNVHLKVEISKSFYTTIPKFEPESIAFTS